MARGDSQSKGATPADPEPEALGFRGFWWKDLGKGQGRRSTRTVQIAGQKMCLHGRGIFKSITQCCKTKPPTMLLVGREHSDNSRRGSSKALRHLRLDFADLGAGTPLLIRLLFIGKMNSDLSNAFCRSLERDAVCRKICFGLPSGADRAWRSPELSHCFPFPPRLSTAL